MTSDVPSRHRPAWLACACSLGILLWPGGSVRADTPPNTWDVARDPAVRERWALHVRIERLLAPPHRDDEAVAESGRDVELRLEAARAMLEGVDAAHSPDVRLRFDLGEVYYRIGDRQGGRDDLFEKAAGVLVPALDAGADHPAATAALEVLAYAYAKLNRPQEELAAWRRYIPRLGDERRVSAMMNMGEAEMRLGHIDDALGTFREVLRLCGELPNTSGISQTYVLGLWDVAIALDRSGDPQGALDAAGRARRMGVMGPSGLPLWTGSTLIASDPSVFFVPPWEREWYLALDAMAASRDAHDGGTAAALWGEADRHWAAYVEQSAAAGGDPFLPIARVRLRRAHDKHVAANRAAAKLPRPATQDGLP